MKVVVIKKIYAARHDDEINTKMMHTRETNIRRQIPKVHFTAVELY